jgi:hypothetical protein
MKPATVGKVRKERIFTVVLASTRGEAKKKRKETGKLRTQGFYVVDSAST